MYITSTGMVCSVGLNAEAACAAMRAGIAGFRELPFKADMWEPVVGAVIPNIELDIGREERLIELLERAITECILGLESSKLKRVPLLVGLAESERPGGSELADRIVAEIESRLGLKFLKDRCCVVPMGHTSGFEALRRAREILLEPNVSACLVCGVDSYINAVSLNWLDQSSRLKWGENTDGVIPGEAAAAVMIRKDIHSDADLQVGIPGLGFGYEPVNVLSDEPLLGSGLAAAMQAALAEAGVEMHEVDLRLADVTGESYGFKEQVLALARVMRGRREEAPIWHCADSMGDVGAASGVCQLVFAFHAFIKGYVVGDRTLCCTCSLDGKRAVAMLHLQRA